jgi:SpoVK/Ycf46/Vps4 family AAA+-type ATPase
MFLSFLDNTQPDSLVVAVADHRSLLDDALLRRFDTVIPHALPDFAQVLRLLRQRLAAMDTSAVSWDEVCDHVRGLSPAGLVRAAESAAKQAILSDSGSVSTAALVTSLGELSRAHHVMGFSCD